MRHKAHSLAACLTVFSLFFIAGSIRCSYAADYNVPSGTTDTETNSLTGSQGVTKDGQGTLILNGSANNTYTGATVVNAGGLVLSNSSGNAIDSSSGITVNSGASLILGASNQIGDGVALTLNGGTFMTGTSSARYSETLGTLTLTDDSVIDLGSYSGGATTQLTFANSSGVSWTSGKTLTITNWQGVAQTSSSVGEIIFGTGGLTSTQLAQVYWADQSISGGQLLSGTGELVPVPEPRVYAAAVVLLAVVGWRERKRIAAFLGPVWKS